MRFGIFFRLSSVGGLLLVYGCGQKATGIGDDLTAITLSPPTTTIGVGQTTRFTATISGVTDPVRLTWSSSDSRVATVDSLGNATGVGPGTADIEASAGVLAGQSVIVVTGVQASAAPRFVKSKVQPIRSSLGPSSAP